MHHVRYRSKYEESEEGRKDGSRKNEEWRMNKGKRSNSRKQSIRGVKGKKANRSKEIEVYV